VSGTKTFGIPTGGEPAHGALSGFNPATGDVTYTPAAGYNGPDVINFTVSDGALYATGLVSVTVTSGKATPTVAVNNSPVIYNGTPQAAVVVGSVPGTVSDIQYNGSSTPPTAAGTYAVTADFVPTDTVNYHSLNDAPAGNFVISSQTTPTVAVNNSPVIYNGTPQVVVVVGSVPGVVSDIQYNGSSTPPTAAGTYTVTVDFAPTDTVNYDSLNDAPAGDFVITPAALTVSGLTASNKVYDGTTVAALSTVNAALVGLVHPPTVTVDIGFRVLASSSSSGGNSTYTTANYQVGSNCLALAAVVSSDTSPATAPTNFSGNGLTWERILTTNFNTVAAPIHNLTVYAAMSNNVSAVDAGTVSFVNSRSGCSIYICEFTNVWFADGVLGAIVQRNAVWGNTRSRLD